jgi:hypothetical protein
LCIVDIIHCKKKHATVWSQKLYIGEYSGINSLKLKKFRNIELKVRAFMNIFLNFQDGFFTVYRVRCFVYFAIISLSTSYLPFLECEQLCINTEGGRECACQVSNKYAKDSTTRFVVQVKL